MKDHIMKPNTKVCPFCGEEIKAAAIKCRYCKQMLNGQELPADSKNPTTFEVPEKKSDNGKNPIWSGLGSLISFAAIAWLFFGHFSSCSSDSLKSFDPVDEVEKVYLENAQKGDVHSQIELAMYYSVCGSPDKAKTFMRKAAENNSQDAQFYLANMLIDEDSTAAENKEGVKLLHKLADAGVVKAKVILGELYVTKNNLVETDTYRGFTLLSEAAEEYKKQTLRMNRNPFQRILSPWDLNFERSPGVRKVMLELFDEVTYLQEYCNIEEEYCFMWLGLCYREGVGTYKNYDKGVELIEKALKYYEAQAKSSPVAQYRLGLFYYYGLGVEEDKNKGMELLKKSAQKFYLAQNHMEKLKNEQQ